MDETALALWGGQECTINRVGRRYRDQLSPLGGLRADDVARFAALGMSALRVPLLWERAVQDGSLDFADAPLAEMQRLRLTPIVGLIHHGSGPPGRGLLSPRFAPGLAAHAAAVAARFPHVTHYTPVNEPLTTARFACLYGLWHPHRQDERACWVALLNQIDATRLSMRAVRRVNPRALLVQTEDFGRAEATPAFTGQAAYENERRWLTWDLLCGRVVPGHPLWERLAAHGLGRRLECIAADPCPPDIIGINHYLTSNRYLSHEQERLPHAHPAGDGAPCLNVEAVRTLPRTAGWGDLLAEAWARYHIPLAVTECHNGCTREEQLRWFHQCWQAVLKARADGADVRAVTAWSLLGARDWNSLLTRDDGHYEPGVFDARHDPPRPTALARLLPALARGEPPPHRGIVEGQGWWQRPQRFLPGFGTDPAPAPDAPAGPPVLVTGRQGTLARALARAARHRGLALHLAGRPDLDILLPDSIARLLDTVQPWAVVNCAGIVSLDAAEDDADLCHQVNALAPGLLARACAASGIAFVQISTDQVFGGRDGAPYTEHCAIGAINAYGRAKAEAEARVLDSGAKALVARTAAFFSPFDPYNFAWGLADRLARGQAFEAASDQQVSPTYVPDLADALLDLLLDEATGLWHLATPGGLSWASFGRRIATSVGLDPALVRPVASAELGQRAPRPADVRLTSARQLLLPPLGDAIARFAAMRRLAGAEAPRAAA